MAQDEFSLQPEEGRRGQAPRPAVTPAATPRGPLTQCLLPQQLPSSGSAVRDGSQALGLGQGKPACSWWLCEPAQVSLAVRAGALMPLEPRRPGWIAIHTPLILPWSYSDGQGAGAASGFFDKISKAICKDPCLSVFSGCWLNGPAWVSGSELTPLCSLLFPREFSLQVSESDSWLHQKS